MNLFVILNKSLLPPKPHLSHPLLCKSFSSASPTLVVRASPKHHLLLSPEHPLLGTSLISITLNLWLPKVKVGSFSQR